jgi:hypothetical protein
MLPSPSAIILPCMTPAGRSLHDSTIAEVVHSGFDQILSEFELHWVIAPETSIVHLLSPRRRRHAGNRVEAFVRRHAPRATIAHDALVPFAWRHHGPPSINYILHLPDQDRSGMAPGMEINGCTITVIDVAETDLPFDALL